jgi:hypothetical protein
MLVLIALGAARLYLMIGLYLVIGPAHARR